MVRQRGKASSKQVRCTSGEAEHGTELVAQQWPTTWPLCMPTPWCRQAWALATHRFRCLPAFDSLQKQRKRKSLEKALAVASRTETKVAKTSAKKDGKKGLKKLWSNDPKDDK